jgi:hypothetical protein
MPDYARSTIVTVNYDAPFDTMVKAGGYDFVNPMVRPELFPPEGSGQRTIEIKLLRFPDREGISTEEVLAEMRKNDLRPINIAELFTLGAAVPELQREAHIVCLGSAVPDDEELLVPCLFGYAHERRLGVNHTGLVWTPSFQFAGVAAST